MSRQISGKAALLFFSAVLTVLVFSPPGFGWICCWGPKPVVLQNPESYGFFPTAWHSWPDYPAPNWRRTVIYANPAGSPNTAPSTESATIVTDPADQATSEGAPLPMPRSVSQTDR